jgi:hypothetical protein
VALHQPELLANRAQLTGSSIEASSELGVVLERTEWMDGHVAEQAVDSVLLFLKPPVHKFGMPGISRRCSRRLSRGRQDFVTQVVQD